MMQSVTIVTIVTLGTHEIGSEFTVEGSVPGLPLVTDEHPQFRWNLVWYYVKDQGGIYPVVNYVVMPAK